MKGHVLHILQTLRDDLKDLFVFLYMYVNLYEFMQRGASKLLELGLQAVVSFLMQVWESNSGPLEKQEVFLITQLSLQAQKWILKWTKITTEHLCKYLHEIYKLITIYSPWITNIY